MDKTTLHFFTAIKKRWSKTYREKHNPTAGNQVWRWLNKMVWRQTVIKKIKEKREENNNENNRQKTIRELSRRLNLKQCTITRIAGAYVDAEKNIITRFNETFLNMEDTEMFKYLNIIKKIYSTKIDEKMLTLEFDPADLKQDAGIFTAAHKWKIERWSSSGWNDR